MQPFVSIIVPTYNVEQYIDRCIDSLVRQDIADAEFIFVDDGSSDKSAAKIANSAVSDKRVKLLHQENGGCASARNAGLRAARGTYVGFVDADDWVDDGFFERLSETAKITNADVVQGNFNRYYQTSDTFEQVAEDQFSSYIDKENLKIIDRKELMYMMPTIWRRLYRKDFLSSNNIDFFTELKRFDDLPFQFLVLLHANTMAFVGGPAYNYRLERQGQDVAIDDARLFVHLEIFEILRAEVEARGIQTGWEVLERIARSTHQWGLERIRPSLRTEYTQRAEACNAKTIALCEKLRGTWRSRLSDFFRYHKRFKRAQDRA